MVALTQDSPFYKEIFAGQQLDGSFKSEFPPRAVLEDALGDDSLASQVASRPALNGSQAQDIRNGARAILHDMTVVMGDQVAINFPTKLLPGLAAVIKSNTILGELTDDDVFNRVMATQTPPGIPGVIIGAALFTLTVTVPLVGLVASAIVGVASTIANLVKRHKEQQIETEEARQVALYKTFPPLQTVGGAETDGFQVQAMRAVFRSNDWTSIYAPRFKGKKWVGVERKGGFAFAPGDVLTDADTFAGDVGEKMIAYEYKADPMKPGQGRFGVGVIPGTDVVTSVIQVSLSHDKADPYSGPFRRFLAGAGSDPRAEPEAWRRVFDVGAYYPSTGRLAAMFWDMAMQNGNWWKYRIDANALLYLWSEYCYSAITFILEKCYPWGGKHMIGSGPVGPIYDSNSDFEDYFGTGIFFGVGVFTGRVTGGSTFHPEYKFQPAPGGRWRDEIVQPDLYRRGLVNSSNSGAFLPILDPADVPMAGLGTIFDRGPNIKGKLEALQQRQRWELKHTLVSAYCSQDDAAFAGDKSLRDLLLQQRALLLDSEDRFYIELDDVPEGEVGIQGKYLNWESWKKQLMSRGVTGTPKGSPKGGLKMAPPNDPEPNIPPVTPGSGWPTGVQQIADPGAGGGAGGGIGAAMAAGSIGAALVAAAAVALKGRSRARGVTPRPVARPNGLAGRRWP